MTTIPTTTGITALSARPDPAGLPGRRWIISFASAWPQACHQLYVNGRLVAWTDAPGERQFVLDGAAIPQELAVAACPPAARTTDVAAVLGLASQAQGWVYRLSMVQSANARPGDRLEVLDEAGELLAADDLRPPWQPPWAFGDDTFGQGGFGYDGALAPGLGEGAFGAGEFGFDGYVLSLDVPLTRPGLQTLTIRTSRPDAGAAALEPITVTAAPIPPCARAISFDGYDPLTDIATFAIEKG